MNILIIGGTGFLGSYLRKHLADFYHVDHTYANSESPGGIRYRAGEDRLNDVVHKKYDIIVNNINPLSLTYSQALSSTEDVVSFCNQTHARLIHISSVSAIFENRFSNSYNLKKAIAEDLVRTETVTAGSSILRFTQLFDADGLSRASQAGLYYLLKEIKYNRAITVFSNHKACLRNYMPVELAVKMVRSVIEKNLSGIFNAHLDAFTLSFDELLKTLTSLNKGYDSNELIKPGDKEGLAYVIPGQSDELAATIGKEETIGHYFANAYEAIT
jgi:nucleoside-diphosphate-sugar epimerase